MLIIHIECFSIHHFNWTIIFFSLNFTQTSHFLLIFWCVHISIKILHAQIFSSQLNNKWNFKMPREKKIIYLQKIALIYTQNVLIKKTARFEHIGRYHWMTALLCWLSINVSRWSYKRKSKTQYVKTKIHSNIRVVYINKVELPSIWFSYLDIMSALKCLIGSCTMYTVHWDSLRTVRITNSKCRILCTQLKPKKNNNKKTHAHKFTWNGSIVLLIHKNECENKADYFGCIGVETQSL